MNDNQQNNDFNIVNNLNSIPLKKENDMNQGVLSGSNQEGNNINSFNVNNTSQVINQNINNNVNSNINSQMNVDSNGYNNQNIDSINLNKENQFLNFSEYNETSINDLNVSGDYNQIKNTEQSQYSNDPKVIENINKSNKKSVTITKELKTVIVIAIILLLFIIVIPNIFDFVSKIRY